MRPIKARSRRPMMVVASIASMSWRAAVRGPRHIVRRRLKSGALPDGLFENFRRQPAALSFQPDRPVHLGPRRGDARRRDDARKVELPIGRRSPALNLNAEGFNVTIFPLRPPVQGRRQKSRNRSIAAGRSSSTTRLTPRNWARSTNCSWQRRSAAEEKASRGAKIDAFRETRADAGSTAT